MSLPSRAELQALLDYDPLTGVLRWKPRPLSMFSSQRACSTWNARYAGELAFTAIDRKGYNVGAIHDRNYRAPRVIWKWVYDVDPIQVDHEDGDTQNNRLKNLRDISGEMNQKNMKKASNNTSGVTGVIWRADKQRWSARININKKQKLLGHFIEFDDAVAARKEAEKQHGYHPNHGR